MMKMTGKKRKEREKKERIDEREKRLIVPDESGQEEREKEADLFYTA